MKNFIIIITFFLCFNSFSQSRDTIYFLINKKDTLIKKQIATKLNKYEGYLIINEKRRVKKIRRSSDISGDDVEYDAFEDFSFSFNRKKDTIISKSYLKSLNLIRDRSQFISTMKEYLNKSGTEYIFIEPIKCNKFILRKVEVLTFE